MKKTVIIFYMLGVSILAHAQIPYYTAIGIKNHCVRTDTNTFSFKKDPESLTKLSAYLKGYLIENLRETELIEDQVFDHFTNNSFFGPQIKALSGASSGFLSGKISNLASSVGGIEIPNHILLGVTDFIIKRTKQELSIAFFERFKELISSPDYIDLQTVFPQTYINLMTIGDEIYQYEAYIQSLRESFRRDIENLNTNLPTIIENHPEFWNRHPEWKASMQSAFYLAESLSEQMHPGDILNEYPPEYLDSLNLNWKGAIQTLQLISASLRDTVDNKDSAYWVSPRQVRNLVKDSIAFRIYLGLIYQQVKTRTDTIKFRSSTNSSQTLLSILDKVAVHYQQSYTAYGNYITHVSEKASIISSLINNSHNEEENDSIAIQKYYNYYIATLNLLEQCTEISTLPYFKDIIPGLADSLKGYFAIARSTANLVMEVRMKSYSSAITSAAHIYDLVKANPAERDISAAEDLKKKKNGEEKKSAAASKNMTMEYHILDTRNYLFKFGSFMAAMATAKTPDDVEKAVEAVALPTGSSRVKRETTTNVALNVYTGLYAGNEVIKDVDPDKLLAKFNSFGLTVPIGISFSKGHRFLPWPLSELNAFETKAGWSSSLFVSLVDLGAVAAYRVANDSIDQVPSIQLEDIFSPGIFWSIGIPKSPISINAGVQVGPNLRKVDSEVNEYANNIYTRFSISVCVDLPVLNLYTKSRFEKRK